MNTYKTHKPRKKLLAYEAAHSFTERKTFFSSQVAVTITNEKSVSTVLSSIGRNLLKTDVTWGKIASLYCVAGGLAIDCVQQGHPEYLYGIVETMGFVIERDAATWIAQQGGWVSNY